MNRNFKILVAVVVFTTLLTQDKICEHLGFGPILSHPVSKVKERDNKPVPAKNTSLKEDTSGNETLYRWDDSLFRWVALEDTEKVKAILASYTHQVIHSGDPVEIKWEMLMDIRYKLRYFEELDMEIYAPVFGKAQTDLDGKEVIIEGFVIPFDEEADLISLSANPYASCFFCGQASPASVISLHMNKKRRRYKMDEFLKFRGTLHLNYDDPDEFYYILRDAEEASEY